jgi:hypothetical protein
MSDTVTASAIVASLSYRGPSFILDLGTSDPMAQTAPAAEASSFHVDGGAHPSPVSGFGSLLLVDFVTWHPTPTATAAPPTATGGAGWTSQDAAFGVAGAIHVAFDHL